jgi:hypothetical protein
MLAVPGMEIRADRIGLDPLIALHPDGGLHSGWRDGLRPRRDLRGLQQKSAGEQACSDDAAGGWERSPSCYHCRMSLLPLESPA